MYIVLPINPFFPIHNEEKYLVAPDFLTIFLLIINNTWLSLNIGVEKTLVRVLAVPPKTIYTVPGTINFALFLFPRQMASLEPLFDTTKLLPVSIYTLISYREWILAIGSKKSTRAFWKGGGA